MYYLRILVCVCVLSYKCDMAISINVYVLVGLWTNSGTAGDSYSLCNVTAVE